MNFSQDGYFFFSFFVSLFAYENNLFCPCCWEIGSLMDLNTGEMTSLSKDIIFSKKLRKKKEHFQVFVIQGIGFGRLKSSESCHEAMVNKPHCQ